MLNEVKHDKGKWVLLLMQGLAGWATQIVTNLSPKCTAIFRPVYYYLGGGVGAESSLKATPAHSGLTAFLLPPLYRRRE
jgi:hypothetical protein